jgi:hypothetical protein
MDKELKNRSSSISNRRAIMKTKMISEKQVSQGTTKKQQKETTKENLNGNREQRKGRAVYE